MRKIIILEIDNNKIQVSKSLEFKKLIYCDNNKDNLIEKIINVKDIIGTNGIICSKDNWFDYMLKD